MGWWWESDRIPTAFVAAFLREKKLSPQEADELRRMLDESEGGHD